MRSSQTSTRKETTSVFWAIITTTMRRASIKNINLTVRMGRDSRPEIAFARRFWLVFGLLAAPVAGGQDAGPPPPEATAQRPPFTFDTTLTPAGTIELELGGAWAESTRSLPLTLKYTPGRGPIRTTELSLAFDLVAGVVQGGARQAGFGDRLTFMARHPWKLDAAWSLALAPRLSLLLRDVEGMRAGATAVAAYASGLDAVVGNLTFEAATSPSPTHTANQSDIALDYYRTLGRSGGLARWTSFAGRLHQRPDGAPTLLSLMQAPRW
jgi:hypothetical protein